jgi:hypothetical protein
MILMNPTWWHDPVRKILGNYVPLAISHSRINPISLYYFGKSYVYDKPWHVPLTMTLFTLPIPMLMTLLVGIAYTVRRRFQDKLLVLFLLNAAFMLAIVASTNCYDGVRQFLPAFPFLAGISGAGFRWGVRKITRWSGRIEFSKAIRSRDPIIHLLMFVILLLGPLIQLIGIHPYELSYYNACVGGIKGASRKGLEVTYWFDAANQEFLDYLNESLPLKARVSVCPPNFAHFKYLQKKDRLRPDMIFSHENFDYLVILMRKGSFRPSVWPIYHHCSPVYSIGIDETPILSLYKSPFYCGGVSR